MKLYALTAAGFALTEFSLLPDPSAISGFPPTVIEVDHYHVTVTEVPIALSDVASAIDAPVWIHSGRLHTRPPVGPIGTDLGAPTGLECTLSTDSADIRRPVVFDFSSTGHVFPEGAGPEATVTLFRGSDWLWDATLTAEGTTSDIAGTVTVSAKALGAYLTVGPDRTVRVIVPHPKGSLYDAAAIMSTLLLAIYLALVAGTRFDTGAVYDESGKLVRAGRGARHDANDDEAAKWLLLIVDGPLAALGAIVGAAETFETSAAWRHFRYASFVSVCAVGAAVVAVSRFSNAEHGPIEEWERRLIEPALVVALQVPFVGRLGIDVLCPQKPGRADWRLQAFWCR